MSSSGWYSALRTKPFPTLYDENKTPVTSDVLEAGLIYAFVILVFSFFIVLPGIRGKERLSSFIRIVASLFIGTFILLCNFGQEWEYSKIEVTTAYKAFSHVEIGADIEVKIGLRSVNITLRNDSLTGDRVNYNERFSWEWAQGRLGFGPQAGEFNREFRAAQVRGTPFPILWIAEYFTFDGEGIRFGRNYRIAGWYTHILLWTAFPLWLITNIVFFMVLRYGAFYLMLTGATLLTGNIVYGSVRNFIPLEIPFSNHGTIVYIRMAYGWCFWMNMVNGLVCVLLGFVVLYMDLRYPDKIATFFGIDILQDYEEFYADPQEFVTRKRSEPPTVTFVEIDPPPEEETPEREAPALRKRTISNRFQVGSHRRPAPAPRRNVTNKEENPDAPIYENAAFNRFDPIGEEEEQNSSKENILMKNIN